MNLTVLRAVAFCFLTQIPFVGVRLVTTLDGIANGAGPFEVGLLMTLVAFIPTCGAIQPGRYVDANGVARPLYLGLAFLALPALIPLLLPASEFGLAPLFAACALVGIGNVFTTLVIQSYIGFVSPPEEKTTNFAIFTIGYSVGGLVAPVTSGYAIDHFGFAGAYAYLLGATALALLWLCLRAGRLPKSFSTKPKKKQSSNFDLLKHRAIRNVLIVSAFNSMGWDLQNFMVPLYGASIGLSASEIGWIMGSFSLATFAVRALMPAISRHFAQWHCIAGAFALSAFSFFIFPFFDSFYALVAVAFCLGLGLGACLPNLLAICDTVAPEGRLGEVFGLRTMLINICHAGFPLLFGAMGSAAGAGAIFYAVSVVMAGISAFSARCAKTEK